MENIIIRKANLSDVPDIARVHIRSWQVAYQGIMPSSVIDRLELKDFLDRWEERIEVISLHVFVIEVNKTMAGFLDFTYIEGKHNTMKTAEVKRFYLDPDYWRLGLGRKLFYSVLSIIKADGGDKVLVLVLKTNDRARQFYKSVGFKATGEESVSKIIGFDRVVVRYEIII